MTTDFILRTQALNPEAALSLLQLDGSTLSSTLQLSLQIPTNVMPEAKSHQVYNFEVAKHHNYIAGGIRVHNESILSHLGNNGILTDVNLDNSIGEHITERREAIEEFSQRDGS
ncbi:hypothetical protein, partial [Ruegeria sp. ANG-R]|uniref:hypothetical protein n=1 Tax=Ruegeria sp. ANG-R TaxID=1577903 RepID=UPI0019D3BA96